MIRFARTAFARITLGAAAILAGLAAALPAQAGTYVVGVENIEYFPQYSWDGKSYSGFARDLLDAFAKDKGHSFEYRALPVSRLFQDFTEGKLDLKYPDNPLWSSDMKAGKSVVYSQPVVAYIDGVNVAPARKGLGADAVKTLGLVRGFTAWDWMDRIKAGSVTLQENSTFPGLVGQALMGRVDGAYANVAVVAWTLEQQGKSGGLVFDPALPHSRSNYHLSSIKHPALVAEFNDWMAANAAKVAELKAKYQVERGVN